MNCQVCGHLSSGDIRLKERHLVEYKEEEQIYFIYKCYNCLSEFSDPMKPAPADWYPSIGEYYGWRWEFGQFLKDIRNLLPDGRVLEIGCGEGRVVERLEFYDAFGIDFNKDAVEKAKAKGLKVYPFTIEKFSSQFDGITLDAIAFFHILEHVESPLEFLRNVNGILKNNGFIFLSVPNSNRISLVKSRENWDYPPHHLVRFSVNGLVRLISRAGFKILRIREQPKDLPLIYTNSTVELDKFINSTVNLNVMGFNRYVRNALRLPFFVPFNIMNLFIVLKTILKHRGRMGLALYVIAQKVK